MRILFLIMAMSVLVCAPAAAQTPPQTGPQTPSPALAAARSNFEDASRVIKPVFDELKAQGALVRTDPALNPQQKMVRIGELIAARQPEIDIFILAIQAYVREQALAEGATPEQAMGSAAIYRGIVNQTVLHSMVVGSAPQ